MNIPQPVYADEGHDLHVYLGDCLTDGLLAALPDASVDAVVTDPPYGLEFMGKEWDTFTKRIDLRQGGSARFAGSPALPEFRRVPVEGWRAFQDWCEQWAAECLRVLKPGGHMLAFGGTRTWHRLACAVEDAGFEIRDSIAWLYGSGFPKSLDVSKAIDKAAGAEREVIGQGAPYVGVFAHAGDGRPQDASAYAAKFLVTEPATDDARQWQGWGTALKPAFEPIVVARKPLTGTVAQNVLTHGTGALNIDACRIETPGGSPSEQRRDSARRSGNAPGRPGEYRSTLEDRTSPERYMESRAGEAIGRWPANVTLDGEMAAELDKQTGVSRDGVAVRSNVPTGLGDGRIYGTAAGKTMPDLGYGGEGGASRFFPVFRYEAKAPSSERPRDDDGSGHPTVKPLDLMRWLVRLVTPPGGLVLDPFLGSGTTAEACLIEQLRCVGFEKDPDALPWIRRRLDKPIEIAMF